MARRMEAQKNGSLHVTPMTVGRLLRSDRYTRSLHRLPPSGLQSNVQLLSKRTPHLVCSLGLPATFCEPHDGFLQLCLLQSRSCTSSVSSFCAPHRAFDLMGRPVHRPAHHDCDSLQSLPLRASSVGAAHETLAIAREFMSR